MGKKTVKSAMSFFALKICTQKNFSTNIGKLTTEFKDKVLLEIWHARQFFFPLISKFTDKKSADNEILLYIKIIQQVDAFSRHPD
jgi:hypothetical protein